MTKKLVVQFSVDDSKLDEIMQLEEFLESNLISTAVDGHDLGSGEANIFLDTDDVDRSFEEVSRLLSDVGVLNAARIAWRERLGDRYYVLWPKTLTTFKVA